MSNIDVYSGRIYEGSTPSFFARLVDNFGDYITQSDVSSINYYVYNDSNVQTDTDTLLASSVIFDTLQTSASWLDSTGYNFLHVFTDATTWEAGKYTIKYKFTLTSGSVFWCVFRLIVRENV